MPDHTDTPTRRVRPSLLPPADQRSEAGDDYALRKLPAHWKRTPTSLAFVLSGLVWSVFSFSLGGQAALTYGLPSTLVAFAISAVYGYIATGVVAKVTATAGLDLDLVTRGSGYGFLGSAMTSLIYAVTFLMYAGFEAALMADAVHTQWPSVSLGLLYVLASLVVVPLNWYGFTQNDFIQRWTTPLFVIGLVWLAIRVFSLDVHPAYNNPGLSFHNVAGAFGSALPLVAILALNAGDWCRFMRKSDVKRATWIAPTVVIGGVILVEAPLGALMALYTGEGNPSTYAARLMGPVGVLWILLTQIRINNSNFYSGTLALANFSSRILRFVPGRRFWIVVMGAITIASTELGILNHLLDVLTFLGIFVVAWFGTIAADMLVLRPSGRAMPQYVEHRRGYLKSWGWPAVGSLVVGSAVGAVLDLGGVMSDDYAAFAAVCSALLIGFLGPLMIVGLFRVGGNTSARPAEEGWYDDGSITDEQLDVESNMLTCGVCAERHMRQDMVTCPVTDGGVICSVDCASHRTCGDACKKPASLGIPSIPNEVS